MQDRKILEDLEVWRDRHGLSKTAVAKLFGLKSMQAYKNWLARGSIPKDYLSKVGAILFSAGPSDAAKRIKASSRLSELQDYALLGSYAPSDSRTSGPDWDPAEALADADILALAETLSPAKVLEALRPYFGRLSAEERMRFARALLEEIE